MSKPRFEVTLFELPNRGPQEEPASFYLIIGSFEKTANTFKVVFILVSVNLRCGRIGRYAGCSRAGHASRVSGGDLTHAIAHSMKWGRPRSLPEYAVQTASSNLNASAMGFSTRNSFPRPCTE